MFARNPHPRGRSDASSRTGYRGQGAGRGARYWLLRIGRVLLVICGLAFVVDGVLLLWLSEPRGVLLASVLDQARAERVAELDPHLFASPADGTLVHLVGSVVTAGAHDSLFEAGRADLLRLDRHVEMSQWEEECHGRACSSVTYEKRWIGRPVDSSKFYSHRYQNPAMPFTSTTIDAEVRLGPYRVDPRLFDDLLGGLPEKQIAPGTTPEGYRRVGDVLYRSKEEPDRPQIGDLRITYSGVVVPAPTISVVAVWRDGMLRPLLTATLASIGLAMPDAVSAADILATRRRHEEPAVWGLRAGSFAVLLLGFALLYRTLGALPGRLPFLAGIVDRGVLRSVPLLSAVVLSATIGLIWIADQPLIGAGFLAAATALPVVARYRPQPAASATEGFADRSLVRRGGSALISMVSPSQPIAQPDGGSHPEARMPIEGGAVDGKRGAARDPRVWASAALRQTLRYAGKAAAAIGIIFVLSWFTLFFAGLPLIGLATGNLHLAGRGAAITIHGLWARVISVPMLLVYIGGTRSILKQTRGRQGEKAMKRMLAAFVIAACLVGLVFLGMATDNS
jgi:hypothetical protein